MEPQFKDLLEIADPVFFIYIGFCIASLSFLIQYLTFPKTLFTDLSNIKEKGYPRIIEASLEEKYGNNYKKVVSYFFQLDYVTYALLMYILYSVLIVLVLASVHFTVLANPVCFVWGFTIIYVFLRGIVIRQGTFKKQEQLPFNYDRGHDFWTPSERWSLFILECLIFAILVVVLIITTIENRGMLLFLGLIFVLVLMFGWHLFVTYWVGPVTRLLEIWTGLAKDGNSPGTPPVTP